MWRDAKLFWGKTPRRSVILMLGCALVTALLAVNTHLFRSSMLLVPSGVYSEGEFVTLGAYSAEGRFDTASASDMRALDGLGFKGRYTLYGPDKSDVALDGRTWRDLDIAFVSDEFFSLLDVRMAVGSPLSADRSGVVVDNEFWRTELGADRLIAGKMLRIADASVPIAGVAGEQFRGLGDRNPALWLPVRMRAALLQIAIQGGAGVDINAIKNAIADELPTYHAIVALKDQAERERLLAWKVRTTESVTMAASSDTKVTVGVNRRDFCPAILDGIDLVPARTDAITRYLWLLSGLSTVLALLAVLNLAAFWSARTLDRAQEIRIRHALGAKLSDLLRLFAGEALPFLAAIVLLAIPIAWLQLRALRSLEPFRAFLQNRSINLDISDFAPSLLVLLIIGGSALVAPLANLFRGSLRSSVIGATAPASRWRLGMIAMQWLMVGGVAALAGASALAGYRMNNAGWGGEGDPLVVRLPFSEKRRPMFDALHLDEGSAATVEVEPLGALSRKHDAYIPGLDAEGRRLALYENQWSTTAPRELGVSLRAGRMYGAHSAREALVSESYARALGVEPEALLNRPLIRVSTDGDELPPRTIVGVLADLRYSDLRTAPEMVVYVPPEAGEPPSTLLLPQSERGRIDAALREAGRDREIAAALSSVVSMEELRSDRARTETVLSFATFAYALLALGLLMLGIVAEARMQLGQRGRELALIVCLGARLNEAVLRFLRGPLLVALAVSLLVLCGAVAARGQWLPRFPLLAANDVWSVGAVVLMTVGAFGLALVSLAALRLRALSLAELLRVER
jgi:hypothetical protein